MESTKGEPLWNVYPVPFKNFFIAVATNILDSIQLSVKSVSIFFNDSSISNLLEY